MSNSIIDELRRIDEKIFEKLHTEITEEALYEYLKPISDTHAPYQTASWTRAAVIEDLLNKDGLIGKENFNFIRNFQNTGNSVILIGKNDIKKKVWLLAHLDQITYLIDEEKNGNYSLLPICYHLMEPGERPAVAISYNLDKNIYQVIDHGKIVSTNETSVIYIPGGNIKLHPGMRICFDSQLNWNKQTGEVIGSLDDAAGAVSLVLAAKFLAKYDIELMVGLTDEEEGVAGAGNQTIGLGGSRLLRYFDQPDLAIVSDIHEAADMYGGGAPVNMKPGDGASFSEKSAKGLGSVTPPHLYELVLRLSKELANEGVFLQENQGGYVSRSEDINVMVRLPNIALIGFLGKNRHFQRDLESTMISDLVNLTKTVCCLVLLSKTNLIK